MILTKVRTKEILKYSIESKKDQVEKIKAINLASGIIFDSSIPNKFLAALPSYIVWCIELQDDKDFKINAISDWIRLGADKIILPVNLYKKVHRTVDPSLLMVKVDVTPQNIQTLLSKLIKQLSPKHVMVKLSYNVDPNINELKSIMSILTENDNILFNLDIGMSIPELNIDLIEENVSIVLHQNPDGTVSQLYTLFLDSLNFNSKTGLIPVITREDKEILMLAYSNYQTLYQSLKTQEMTYYSRSRKKIWVKGKTSGNRQKLLTLRFDCDKDALIATVEQIGNACHLNQFSCFGDREFSFNELFEVIKNRIQGQNMKSYTKRLALDEEELLRKIREESEEVINYESTENLIWEIGDLMYFILVLMAKKGITIENVKNELRRRRKCK